jgi:hypothetical protein
MNSMIFLIFKETKVNSRILFKSLRFINFVLMLALMLTACRGLSQEATSYPKELELPQKAAITFTATQETNSTEIPSKTMVPTPFHTITPTTEPVSDFHAAIRDLKEKFHASHGTPGWLWYRMDLRDYISIDYITLLMNGKYLPTQYYQENWVHFNEENMVDEAIYRTFAMDGEMIAGAIYTESYFVHDTGQINYHAPYQWNIFDEEHLNFLVENYNQDRHKAFIENLDGKDVLHITARQLVDRPIVYEGVDEAVIGLEAHHYYDLSTGWLIKAETKADLMFGSTITFSEVIYSVRSDPQPPDDILQRIQQKDLSGN